MIQAQIDIVVPTYQRFAILPETLESVQQQTYPHWECWIAEDGRTEETLKAIAPFLKDPRFHYLPGAHSGTPVVPRNRAMRAGQAAYVAFLDDDDIWLPEKLEKQTAFLNEHPDCVLLGTNAFIMTESSSPRDSGLPLYFEKAPFGQIPYSKHVQDNYLINSTVIIRRKTLKEAGLQNEALLKGPGEDYDHWLRIGVLGDIWLLPQALAIYRKRESGNDQAPHKTFESRKQSYSQKYKIYQHALTGAGDTPSPLMRPEYDRQACLVRRERDFHAAGPRFLGRLRHDIASPLRDWLYRSPSKKMRQEKALQAYIECKARWARQDKMSSAACVIFSKDRAMQLHALLTSLKQKVSPVPPTCILYTASTADHQSAYDQLQTLFSDERTSFTFIRQRGPFSFKQDLLDILSGLKADMLFFLVDDIVFLEPVDLAEILAFSPEKFVFSLRMGKNLNRCYVVQSAQPQPVFSDHPAGAGNKIVWTWRDGALDWGYPLSVDGHFFARREMTAMASLISFNAPNSFEDQLQHFKPFFLNRCGIAFSQSRIVNVPLNRVQTEMENISGNIHPDELLAKWHRGYRIDCEAIYGRVNESAHQEWTLPLIHQADLHADLPSR